jgi:hypothetical protein
MRKPSPTARVDESISMGDGAYDHEEPVANHKSQQLAPQRETGAYNRSRSIHRNDEVLRRETLDVKHEH